MDGEEVGYGRGSSKGEGEERSIWRYMGGVGLGRGEWRESVGEGVHGGGGMKEYGEGGSGVWERE